MRELVSILPNSEIQSRRNVGLKKIIPVAIKHGYTDVVVVNQDRRLPSILTDRSIRVVDVLNNL